MKSIQVLVRDESEERFMRLCCPNVPIYNFFTTGLSVRVMEAKWVHFSHYLKTSNLEHLWNKFYYGKQLTKEMVQNCDTATLLEYV